jgi:hypothetical protein
VLNPDAGKAARALFTNSSQGLDNLATTPGSTLVTTKLFGNSSGNGFFVLQPSRIMEFKLPKQAIEPTFFFDLALSKVKLYEAMLNRTDPFRLYFASLSASSPQQKLMTKSTIKQQMTRAIQRLLDKAWDSSENDELFYVDMMKELDEEIWCCFEQGLTPRTVWERWVHEIQSCVELFMITRLPRDSKQRVEAALRRSWHMLLQNDCSKAEESKARLINIFLDIIIQDKEKRLLNFMPQFFVPLVKDFEIGCKEREQFLVVIERASRVFKQVYGGYFDQWISMLEVPHKPELTLNNPRNESMQRQQKMKVTSSETLCSGLKEYLLGRLDKAVMLWSQTIIGKRSFLRNYNKSTQLDSVKVS